MTSREPLAFDPIMRAATLWERRIGPSRTMAAVTSVMRVQQILLSAVDGALRPHGLTFARYEALVLLTFARSGRLPMRTMGERLQLHPTSVTNIVDRLQADGLVRRVPHPTDRRATLVEITEAGAALREKATESVTAIDFGLVGLAARAGSPAHRAARPGATGRGRLHLTPGRSRPRHRRDPAPSADGPPRRRDPLRRTGRGSARRPPGHARIVRPPRTARLPRLRPRLPTAR